VRKNVQPVFFVGAAETAYPMFKPDGQANENVHVAFDYHALNYEMQLFDRKVRPSVRQPLTHPRTLDSSMDRPIGRSVGR